MLKTDIKYNHLDLLRLEMLRLEWLPRSPDALRTTPPLFPAALRAAASATSSESTWMVRGRGFMPAPADLRYKNKKISKELTQTAFELSLKRGKIIV